MIIKNNKRTSAQIFCAVLFMLFVSCNNDISFDKAGWNTTDDPLYPPALRERMLDDLLNNHKLIGLKYSQLEKLIGIPDSKDSNFVYYRVVVDYGHNIDPVYTKNLMFQLLKDSLITSFKVKDWRARKD
ncbi:hypothetical protein SRABI27_01759 [Pedobacter sp. Bi27]|uniref:hypothetical protein n=1 Tax=unclassified Pedobacter TaxID=2628915 RepID=UPI001D423A14|nr:MULTISPECIES: hypothetical protein [unclassified Pedobacter]CAH0177401.1 hypothetical protein SRABI36_01419 [Pedobacter sp. Bi36]CAH0201709.1 hypothetical protein SRABI27_01759 [Pedobacter sp. Bi27]CAH0233284.1 hypothetical protein SRABI126_02512 [Pedobacter sp. Bi126]